jgi:hypothetical protein
MDNGKFLLLLIIIILVGVIGLTIYAKYGKDNKYIYFIVGLLLLLVVGFGFYIMYNKRTIRSAQMSNVKGGNYPDTSFSKISESLDNEHKSIFDALDHFYNVVLEHWNSEKKLFQEGKARLPSNHPDITSMWQEHEQQHTGLIDRIVQIKQDIISHIENYDKPQFHWT